MTPTWRAGIDTGGTFTDIVAVRNGEVRTGKVASTPPDFEEGVLAAIADVDLRPADLILLAHGTTVTTNAVITKTGARTSLLTTEGFRDVLELRRHNRGELYDILWDPPPPLVPRRRRLEVSERVDYAGEVVRPLDEDGVRALVERLRDEGTESLAVCFLHSYAKPEHEERVRAILGEEWPELEVSISSELLREPQEFERTSTTVANAYVAPVLRGYLGRLGERLAADGFAGRLMLMHSGGGLLPAAAAVAVPARTVTSGPAAGATAAESFGDVVLGDETRADGVISLDMGGTSADIAVIRGGRALRVNEYQPEFGLPIRFPAIDLLAIGAGGGSIAWTDAAGIPRVGPQSAGAAPGPACYGRGGTEPTVTDANLVLGRLSPSTTLAGGLRLDEEAAREAVGRFGAAIDLATEEAALGIVALANSTMARAVRVMTVERGLDPRRYVLLPFGGAGPMHACELAEELGCTRVLVPIAPGVTSALGTLLADIVHDLARSAIAPLSSVDPAELERSFAELEAAGRDALRADLVPERRQVLERVLDLRYLGQLKTLGIPVGEIRSATLAAARRSFLAEYERRYHYVTEDIEVELSVVRVRARGVQDNPRLPRREGAQPEAGAERRSVRFAAGRYDTAVLRREELGPGIELRGPLVVEQLDATTVVPPLWTLAVDPQGSLLLSRQAA